MPCSQNRKANVSLPQSNWSILFFLRVYMTCFVFAFFFFRIAWSQFKPYFMFKLEKVMDDFHASAPEQRQQNNPNMDFVPFEEMKKRILKIVDSYIG